MTKGSNVAGFATCDDLNLGIRQTVLEALLEPQRVRVRIHAEAAVARRERVAEAEHAEGLAGRHDADGGEDGPCEAAEGSFAHESDEGRWMMVIPGGGCGVDIAMLLVMVVVVVAVLVVLVVIGWP